VTDTENRWLRWSVAFVWLATGIGVLHPFYRHVGHAYLVPLGLGDGWMIATCVGEVLLAARVALGRATTWISALQALLILGFSAILAWTEPMLTVHPLGVLSKNVPLMAVIITAWLVEREGWSGRALWLLRGGIASLWIFEGLFPKILFQQPEELEIVTRSGIAADSADNVLRLVGIGELALGLAMLCLRGRSLKALLGIQLAALVVLPLMITLQEPRLWVHPFGPFTKNVPIIAGTIVIFRRAPNG
jgi:hypothetical protein